MDKLRDLLTQLGQTEERHTALEGIKPALSSLSRKEAEDGLKVQEEPSFIIHHKSSVSGC